MEVWPKRNEERFKALVQNAFDVITIHDANGIVLYATPSVKRVIGYSPEELEGKNPFEYIHPHDHRTVRDALDSVFEKTNPGTPTPFRFRRSDGSWIYMESVANNLLDHPEVRGVVITSRDISERRKSEDALRVSETRYRTILDLMPDPLLIVSVPDGRLLDVNQAFEGKTGYRRSELVGQRPEGYGLWTDPHRQETIIGHLAETGLTGTYDASLRGKDGRILHVVINARTMEIDQQRVALFLAHDVTEQKNTEEKLRVSEQTFRELADLLPQTVYECDVTGRLTFANRRGFDEFGYSEEDFRRGVNIIDTVIPEDRTNVRKGMEILLQGGHRQGNEYTAIRKDGTTFPMINYVSPIVREGKVAGLRGIVVNIVDRKKAEEERHKLETQLHQFRKIEAIGTLAGGIAHDFNNILSAIIGYCSLLQMKMEGDNPQLVFVKQILSASQKAASLVSSLLAFSRKQVMQLVPQDLNTIVKKIEHLLRRLLTEDIELKISLYDKSLVVMADNTQMDQVLINLATNARDAMPQGGQLAIETGYGELDCEYVKAQGYGEAGHYGLISVTDNGIGMDEKTVEKIFEPFFTTKEPGKGTGLGLSTVYGIVKQHNGIINVRSEKGRGTTFDIYIPLVRAEVDERRCGEERLDRGSGTILIAEDNEELRSLTVTLLTEQGYTVIGTGDGAEAVKEYAKRLQTIDLVLLDLVMPKMNGREAYMEMKKINPSVRVIFTSGYSDEIIKQKGTLEEHLTFLRKPIQPGELLRSLKNALGG